MWQFLPPIKSLESCQHTYNTELKRLAVSILSRRSCTRSVVPAVAIMSFLNPIFKRRFFSSTCILDQHIRRTRTSMWNLGYLVTQSRDFRGKQRYESRANCNFGVEMVLPSVFARVSHKFPISRVGHNLVQDVDVLLNGIFLENLIQVTLRRDI